MKAFLLNEYDVVAAETMAQAIEWYLNETGLSLEDAIEDPSECDTEKTEMKTERRGTVTLANEIAWMQLNGNQFPAMLCSTEY